MPDKKLTLIIPFLNEKQEVENTLKSIIEHSSGEIDILLINDASDDAFDYKSIAEKYNVTYIENPERMGVAASRDLGVELCQTPYFLFLDAHMRLYCNVWVQRIISELEKDKRALLCCQTKVLGLENDLVVERKHNLAYGAAVELRKGFKLMIEPFWVTKEPQEQTTQLQTVPIVCVLGAGYACSKEYWLYLKGLTGLMYYGSDEPYISIKVWLEGGSCKLLKDVSIGHIYRSSGIPYGTEMKFRLYNRLFVAELLLPQKNKKQLWVNAKYFYSSIFSESLLMLHEHREQINQLKDYYKNIFTRDFSFFEKLNKKYDTENIPKDNINDILYNITERIKKQSVAGIGILQGRMGIIIFLFHYARFCKEKLYTEQAEQMLTDLLNEIKPDLHYSFSSGLSGIGWGIEYLYQQGFLEGDTNEILEDFDKKIMEVNPLRIFNLHKNCGLGGIVRYLLARLYTIEKEKKTNPFDSEYLASIYERIQTVIEQRDIACDSVDVFLEFLNYYTKKEIYKPEIYDVWCLLKPKDTPLQDLEIGLLGAAGVGLNLILESQKFDS